MEIESPEALLRRRIVALEDEIHGLRGDVRRLAFGLEVALGELDRRAADRDRMTQEALLLVLAGLGYTTAPAGPPCDCVARGYHRGDHARGCRWRT